jgi:hypothetical protein
MATKVDRDDVESAGSESLPEVRPSFRGSALSVKEDNTVVAASVRCGSNLDAICGG